MLPSAIITYLKGCGATHSGGAQATSTTWFAFIVDFVVRTGDTLLVDGLSML